MYSVLIVAGSKRTALDVFASVVFQGTNFNLPLNMQVKVCPFILFSTSQKILLLFLKGEFCFYMGVGFSKEFKTGVLDSE